MVVTLTTFIISRRVSKAVLREASKLLASYWPVGSRGDRESQQTDDMF